MFDRDLLNKLRNTGRRRAGRNWYSIRNLAAGEAEVFIYDVIGESWYGGVTARDFVQELRAIEAEKILLRINSPGGDVTDALAIRTALMEHPATIETHIDSAAYSCASWIGLTGEKVIMAAHATMMIHEPWDIMAGDAEAFRKEAEMLDIHGDAIADMYAEKAGGTRQEWRDKMRAETWYGDQAAVDAGLADEVSGKGAAENTFDRSILALFRNTPPELLENNQAQPARIEPTKRACEDALRDAGLSSAAAKAVLSAGWPALTPRDAVDGAEELLAHEKLRFESLRYGQLVTTTTGG